MPSTNTLIGFFLLAWFIPAFFFTHRHFKETRTKGVGIKGFKARARFCVDQLSFIFWPIILVIVALFSLIFKLLRKKVKK